MLESKIEKYYTIHLVKHLGKIITSWKKLIYSLDFYFGGIKLLV